MLPSFYAEHMQGTQRHFYLPVSTRETKQRCRHAVVAVSLSSTCGCTRGACAAWGACGVAPMMLIVYLSWRMSSPKPSRRVACLCWAGLPDKCTAVSGGTVQDAIAHECTAYGNMGGVWLCPRLVILLTDVVFVTCRPKPARVVAYWCREGFD